jgi:hypothetical protein
MVPFTNIIYKPVTYMHEMISGSNILKTPRNEIFRTWIRRLAFI